MKTYQGVTGFMVSGIARGLDNPLIFSVVDGKIRGPTTYRVVEVTDVNNGTVKGSKIVVHSTEHIVARLRQYMADQG